MVTMGTAPIKVHYYYYRYYYYYYLCECKKKKKKKYIKKERKTHQTPHTPENAIGAGSCQDMDVRRQPAVQLLGPDSCQTHDARLRVQLQVARLPRLAGLLVTRLPQEAASQLLVGGATGALLIS